VGDDEEKEADGLLPAGAAEWDQVLEQPLRFAPWPYTEIELMRIRDTLPTSVASIADKEAICAASWFVFQGHFVEKYRLSPKADISKELERILRASKELGDAICAASNETLEHLSRHLSPLAVKPPIRAQDLLSHLFWFEHDNRLSFRSLPEFDRIGAPEKTREELLIFQLWTAWSRAHGMRPPKRGWPAFRAACVDPLSDARFPKALHPSLRTDRAWQSLLQRARRRIEGARK
jgi:hypothetical protein